MQYFLNNCNLTTDILHLLLQLCNIPINTNIIWTIKDIDYSNIDKFINIITPMYRPCYVPKFIDSILTSTNKQLAILTVIRQLIKKEGTYELIKQEKYNKTSGKQMVYYLQIKNTELSEPVSIIME
jgi:hypothetical protein